MYTGVGSRDIPLRIQNTIEEVAKLLAEKGWNLRSGGAVGADTAFYKGAMAGKGARDSEIYLPWYGFNNLHIEEGLKFPSVFKNWYEAMEIAESVHPAWEKLSDGAKSLHARNAYQVLGEDLDSPSKFLLCYAKVSGDSVIGGTRTAWEIARKWSVPCFNLYKEEDFGRIRTFVTNTTG